MVVSGVVTAGADEPWFSETGPVEEPLPWASVTKVVSSLACLVAVERSAVDLDEPLGPPGSTVRHVLAHVSEPPH